jgi:hypothetical protein
MSILEKLIPCNRSVLDRLIEIRKVLETVECMIYELSELMPAWDESLKEFAIAVMDAELIGVELEEGRQ